MMAVKILETGPEFRAGPPEQLFSGFTGWQTLIPSTYDVTPDGRFVLLQTSEQNIERPQIVVELNWFEDLKQRVPVR